MRKNCVPILPAISGSPGDPVARFWEKVAIRGADDCWEWEASRNPWGYGQFRIGSKIFTTSRVAFALVKQREPGDLLVCHSCDNPSCCNPAHLWLGTDADNNRDRSEKGRGCGQAETHCVNGHEYTPENSYYPPGTINRRACRACIRINVRRYSERKRAAANDTVRVPAVIANDTHEPDGAA